MKKLLKKLFCKTKIEDKPVDVYTIREGIHGTFFYHMAVNGSPLCGEKATMPTSIPVITWGLKTHLNERYCKECDKRLKEET